MIEACHKFNPCQLALFETFTDWEEFLTMDGYDDCIVGVVERYGTPAVVCYDKNKVLDKLVKDGLSEDEAEEFFYYNQIGAWCGETTPCFITLVPEISIRLEDK